MRRKCEVKKVSQKPQTIPLLEFFTVVAELLLEKKKLTASVETMRLIIKRTVDDFVQLKTRDLVKNADSWSAFRNLFYINCRFMGSLVMKSKKCCNQK